jgi:NADPH-dependent glutamate synthase beta subunit-like oxidoreductase
MTAPKAAAPTLTVSINGRQFAARNGETVLDVARREGIDIPALCQLEGTAAWGGCRLCLVEVEGTSKLQAACTAWVADGLSVQTHTPRVVARRESYLRMYLSDHNAYCEAPCTHACPTHIDIPGYLALLAEGDTAGAAAIVREELPFPGILGRICPRYCEPVCRRGDVDEPIAICALHRAAADHTKVRFARAAASGKRVAVVGAGPAGLSAAWFLAGRGHGVTIYDAETQPGGSLRYTIPEFRLPGKVLDAELQPLWDAGVRFVGGSKMHFETEPEALIDAGFDAVVLATGRTEGSSEKAATKGGKKTAVQRRRLDGQEFLRQHRDGHAAELTGPVVVIGDGMTAIDAARTALRAGAATVTVMSRFSADTMPAGAREIAAAREEGVTFNFETAAAADGLYDEHTTIILAAEDGRADRVDGSIRIGGATLPANRFTGRTSRTGLFVAGDALSGPRSVIHAVAGGKRTALAIDAWLHGEDLAALEEQLAAHARLPYLEQLEQGGGLSAVGRRLTERDPVWLKMGIGAEPQARAAMPKVSKLKRLSGLDVEVEKGYTLAAAQAEAKRCLQCECPSLGDCDLQRLGVEYGITTNDLVKKGSRVRVVEPQLEHPFIRRNMERCIACGRCVRV